MSGKSFAVKTCFELAKLFHMVNGFVGVVIETPPVIAADVPGTVTAVVFTTLDAKLTATSTAPATSAVCALAPITKIGKLTVESAAPARFLMSPSFVAEAANTGAAKLRPAIKAEPVIAANFLNCIYISSV